VNAFKKCCFSSALDETDCDILWNDSEEDRNVRRDCKMKVLWRWRQGHWLVKAHRI
jgi:hypothetical protein